MKTLALHAKSGMAKLTKNHCAHLRAVAQGVPLVDAARRYLGIQYGHEAMTAHREALDLTSAAAHRQGDSRWRLLGATLPTAALPAAVPTLKAWAEAEGLGDWSADELLAIYEEKFGAGNSGPAERRRNERLRTQRLALLHELEAQAAEPATPADQLAGWLSPPRARAARAWRRQLGRAAGLDRPWRAPVAACGHMGRSKPHVCSTSRAVDRPGAGPHLVIAAQRRKRCRLVGRARSQPGGAGRGHDRAAVQVWIAARAGSALTAKAYEREADGFILWCVLDRRKALSDAGGDPTVVDAMIDRLLHRCRRIELQGESRRTQEDPRSGLARMGKPSWEEMKAGDP